MNTFLKLVALIVVTAVFPLCVMAQADVQVSGIQVQGEKKQDTKVFNLDAYGFSIEVPESLGLYCDPAKDTPDPLNPKKNIGMFCNNRINSDLHVQIGWRAKDVENNTLLLRVAGVLALTYSQKIQRVQVKDCNNVTGIEYAVGANFYPNGKNFSSKAVSCYVVAEDGTSFSIIQYVFFVGKKRDDPVNWITISDFNKRGTATIERMIDIAKGIRKTHSASY